MPKTSARKKSDQPVTLEIIREAHRARQTDIRVRLAEFRAIYEQPTNERLWEELVFCIFTAGASARMGLRAVESVRPLLKEGTHAELSSALAGKHRYPNARAGYIVSTREFLQDACGMDLRSHLESFSDPLERRDWLARTRGVKGLGYKEASHYLRNIGYRGYAILDKHILRSLHELGAIDSPAPPATRARYLEVENRFKDVAAETGIDFDELDLVLWSMRTGEILK